MYTLKLCCPLSSNSPEELAIIRPKDQASQQTESTTRIPILISDFDLDLEADLPLKLSSKSRDRSSFFDLFRKSTLTKSSSAGVLKYKQSSSSLVMDRPSVGPQSNSGPSSASGTPKKTRKNDPNKSTFTQRKSENFLLNNGRRPGSSSDTPPQEKIELKVVILGSVMVGKTAMSNQFQYKVFIHDYTPTVEDFGWIEYDMNWAEVMLQIIDTSGSNDFLAMRNLYMRTGDAFLLVFSVDDPGSWEEAQNLYKEIKVLNGKKAPIQVVANKIDKFVDDSDWDVPRQEIDRFISDNRANLAEISAKDYEQVEQVFRQLLQQTQMASVLSEPLKKRRQSTPAAMRNNRGSGPRISNEDLERLKKAAAAQESRSRSGSCKIS